MKKADLIKAILEINDTISKKELKKLNKGKLEKFYELSKKKVDINKGQDEITEHGLNVEIEEEEKVNELYKEHLINTFQPELKEINGVNIKDKIKELNEPKTKSVSIQVASLIDPELEIRMKYLQKKICDKSLSKSARDKYFKLYNKYHKMIKGDMYN